MDVVYICRAGDNEELRYSIRSVVKNLKHDKIWVVGQKPDWYVGNFLPVPDKRLKYANARNNLKAIVNSKDISDDFILMNDDFFIMKKIEDLLYFYAGFLEDRALHHESISSKGAYTRMLYSTFDRLNSLGIKDPLDYELHIPMIMNKEKLLHVLKHRHTLWRSMYGNLYSVGGEKILDVKVYSNNTINTNSFNWKKDLDYFLSTQDTSFEKIKEELFKKIFSKPSIYELNSLS